MENIIKGTSVSVIEKILKILTEKINSNLEGENGKIPLEAEDLTLITILYDTFPGLITVFDSKKEIKSCCFKTLKEEIENIRLLLDKIN